MFVGIGIRKLVGDREGDVEEPAIDCRKRCEDCSNLEVDCSNPGVDCRKLPVDCSNLGFDCRNRSIQLSVRAVLHSKSSVHINVLELHYERLFFIIESNRFVLERKAIDDV